MNELTFYNDINKLNLKTKNNISRLDVFLATLNQLNDIRHYNTISSNNHFYSNLKDINHNT